MRLAVVLALAGCGRVGFDTSTIEGTDGPTLCTFGTFGAFGAPQPVTELNTPVREWAPSVSRDGRSMMFSRVNNNDDQDLLVATRDSTSEQWGEITPIAELNTSAGEDDPTLSADGLELIFGDGSLLRSTRTTGTFGPAVEIYDDVRFVVLEGPELTADDLTLYFNAASDQPNQLFTATRGTRAEPFTGFAPLVPNPDPIGDAGWPTLSSDELELIFSSAHGGERDLWTSRRATTSDPFPPATRIDELSAPGEDYDPELSFDGTTIWFASDRSGTSSQDIYVATRSCQ